MSRACPLDDEAPHPERPLDRARYGGGLVFFRDAGPQGQRGLQDRVRRRPRWWASPGRGRPPSVPARPGRPARQLNTTFFERAAERADMAGSTLVADGGCHDRVDHGMHRRRRERGVADHDHGAYLDAGTGPRPSGTRAPPADRYCARLSSTMSGLPSTSQLTSASWGLGRPLPRYRRVRRRTVSRRDDAPAR